MCKLKNNLSDNIFSVKEGVFSEYIGTRNDYAITSYIDKSLYVDDPILPWHKHPNSIM